MKRIFKTALAIASSLFISKAEAKNSEINNRVVRIRAELSQQMTNEKSASSDKLINYLELKHDLYCSIDASVNWNNWNNWLKSTWNNWSKNSLPNWNNWLKSNWNNWFS